MATGVFDSLILTNGSTTLNTVLVSSQSGVSKLIKLPDDTGTLSIVTRATVTGNLPEFLGPNGSLQDSGIAASAIAQKSGASTNGDLASFNGSNQIVDSGIAKSDVALLDATQTFTAQNTFSHDNSGILLTGATNQISFQPSGTGSLLQLQGSAPVFRSTINFPDPSNGGSTSNVIYDTTDQTISGSKTFTNQATFSHNPGIFLTGTGNCLTFQHGGSGQLLVISATQPSMSSTVNFPDPNIGGGTASIVYGPASATSGNLASFNGNGGTIQDSGISYQTTGNIATTYTGIWATSQAATLRANLIGNVVTISGTQVYSPATISAHISCSYVLPSIYRPTVVNSNALFISPIIVSDNGSWILGTVNINTSGAITFTNTTNLGNSGNFVGAGNSGPTAWSVSYSIQ